MQSAHNLFSEQRTRQSSAATSTKPTTSIVIRNRYNPTAESIYAIACGAGDAADDVFAILTAVSVAREKGDRHDHELLRHPTTRLEFLIGKQLPYIGVGMWINFFIMTTTVLLLFDVPLKGDGLTLTLGALYVAAATGYGLFISTFTSSQVAAVFAGAVLSMLPTMQFSGMMQPVSTLEGGARFMGYLWPTSYYLHGECRRVHQGTWLHRHGDRFAGADPVRSGLSCCCRRCSCANREK